MRITTKVVLGFALVCLIAFAAYLYQTYLIGRMQQAEEELADIGFRTGLTTFRVRESILDIEEFSYKYLASGEEFYLSEVETLRSLVADELQTLLSVSLFEDQLSDKAEQILSIWTECNSALSDLEAARREGAGELQQLLETRFGNLSAGLQDMAAASETFQTASTKRSQQMRENATWASRTALAVALVLAVLVSALIYRSISSSLKRLTEGTRRISTGDFGVRIRETGGDELSQLAADLNRMARQLGALDQLKRDFVSHVSHDLRAPLASIQETTRLLLEDMSSGLDATQKRLLELNLSSSRRLSSMISDLLDLSRLEAGMMPYELEVSNAQDLVCQALENLHGLCLEKQLSVQVEGNEESVHINVDRLRFGQVLGNLISNAISFSPRGGTLRVVSTRLREPPTRSLPHLEKDWSDRGKGFCHIAILDQGPGVPENQWELIFDRFYSRGEERGNDYQGTGLGLTITRRIIQDLHGVLWVDENPEGRGSRFNVLLSAC